LALSYEKEEYGAKEKGGGGVFFFGNKGPTGQEKTGEKLKGASKRQKGEVGAVSCRRGFLVVQNRGW